MLKSQGHIFADLYPIWRIWSEALIVQSRINRDLVNATVSRYLAGMAANPQSKKGAKQASKLLNDFLKGLSDG